MIDEIQQSLDLHGLIDDWLDDIQALLDDGGRIRQDLRCFIRCCTNCDAAKSRETMHGHPADNVPPVCQEEHHDAVHDHAIDDPVGKIIVSFRAEAAPRKTDDKIHRQKCHEDLIDNVLDEFHRCRDGIDKFITDVPQRLCKVCRHLKRRLAVNTVYAVCTFRYMVRIIGHLSLFDFRTKKSGIDWMVIDTHFPVTMRPGGVTGRPA